MKAFRSYAEHHVPWYLRPNFVAERSAYGVSRGILVGSFVANSCALAEAVRATPQDARHIQHLFVDTLGGLRGPKRTVAPGQMSVVSALKAFCAHEKVPEHRWARAAELFGGAVLPAQDLWWDLLGLPSLDWQRSAIHGDLHGENVRVRKEKAILIDFAHACIGPASADLAHLEVSLIFDARAVDLQGEAWRRAVLGLYSPEAIAASLLGPGGFKKDSWMGAEMPRSAPSCRTRLRIQAARRSTCACWRYICYGMPPSLQTKWTTETTSTAAPLLSGSPAG
jgi:hypothetical protein